MRENITAGGRRRNGNLTVGVCVPNLPVPDPLQIVACPAPRLSLRRPISITNLQLYDSIVLGLLTLVVIASGLGLLLASKGRKPPLASG